MLQQAWTIGAIEAFEAIELPSREAFTSLCGGFITVDLDVCIDVDLDLNVDLDLDGDSGSGGDDCS